MKIYILLVLSFLIIFFSSCNENEKERIYYANGNIKAEYETQDGIRNGIGKMYYPNGVLETVLYYKEGKINGKVKSYDSQGRISSEEDHFNNLRHGHIVYYYPNGKIEDIYYYFAGVRHGKTTGYHPNGKLRVEGQYLYGRKNGQITFYYPNGKLKEIDIYNKDTILYEELYDKNGNLDWTHYESIVKIDSDSIPLGDTVKARIILYKFDSSSNMIIRVGFATIEEYKEFKKPKGNPPTTKTPYYFKEPFDGVSEVEFIPEKKGIFILHGRISFKHKGDTSNNSPFYKEIIVY